MIDATGQVNAVDRQVGGRTLAAGEARVVTVSQVYDADVEDLWDACTSAERIPRWFLPVSGELKAGGRYQLEGNAGGTIERCDPPTSFAATWEYGGSISWIEVRVAAAGDGRARFTLEHVMPVDDDDKWAEFGPGAVGVGWDMGLLGLGQHLSDPDWAVDPAAAMAWLFSDGGRAFVSQASERWRAAHVAAGAPQDDARAAAERTAAAYTTAPEG